MSGYFKHKVAYVLNFIEKSYGQPSSSLNSTLVFNLSKLSGYIFFLLALQPIVGLYFAAL